MYKGVFNRIISVTKNNPIISAHKCSTDSTCKTPLMGRPNCTDSHPISYRLLTIQTH